MTCTELTSQRNQHALSLAASGTGIVTQLWRAYWRWNARRATVKLLHSLDRRSLKDIGIDPSEIESIVHGRPADRTRSYRADWHGRGVA